MPAPLPAASERPLAAGAVAQWLEPAAHNGLVAGSRPAGPTNKIRGFSRFLAAQFLRPHSYPHRNSFPLFPLGARSVADTSDSGLQIVRMMVPVDLLKHFHTHA